MKRTLTKRRVAEEICVLYHEAIRGAVASVTKAGRTMPSRTLDEVDKNGRRAFLSAARACMEMGADPREYVVAQFAAWREASAYHSKFLIPSPQHMGSDAARIRYLQHQAAQEVRASRIATIEPQEDRKRFFVEDRKLRGLARMQRRDPVDVLAEQPEQFSREFLEHKGVWGVVESLWQDRRHS